LEQKIPETGYVSVIGCKGGKLPTQLNSLERASLDHSLSTNQDSSQQTQLSESFLHLHLMTETDTVYEELCINHLRQWITYKIMVIFIVTHHHKKHLDLENLCWLSYL
jgi:hypothetical protein